MAAFVSVSSAARSVSAARPSPHTAVVLFSDPLRLRLEVSSIKFNLTAALSSSAETACRVGAVQETMSSDQWFNGPQLGAFAVPRLGIGIFFRADSCPDPSWLAGIPPSSMWML